LLFEELLVVLTLLVLDGFVVVVVVVVVVCIWLDGIPEDIKTPGDDCIPEFGIPVFGIPVFGIPDTGTALLNIELDGSCAYVTVEMTS
jgi:hypothetical protein